MTKTGFKRIFTDNNEYESYEGILFFNSLAYTVQEFLYTSKAKDENNDFQMDKHIKLYDFMNVTASFIKAIMTDFGRTTIKEYIEDIRQDSISVFDVEEIEYKYDILIIRRASNELIMALLWTTYIYVNAQLSIVRSELWEDKKKMLYEVMLENSSYPQMHFKNHTLILLTDEATKTLIKHSVNDQETYDDLVKQFKQEKEEIVEQEEEAKQDDDHVVVEEISLHDKVRLDLVLRMMEDNGANLTRHGNKMKAAQIMQSITGLPLQTCKNYCSNRDLNTSIHTEEVLKMNTILQALGMKIRL